MIRACCHTSPCHHRPLVYAPRHRQPYASPRRPKRQGFPSFLNMLRNVRFPIVFATYFMGDPDFAPQRKVFKGFLHGPPWPSSGLLRCAGGVCHAALARCGVTRRLLVLRFPPDHTAVFWVHCFQSPPYRYWTGRGSDACSVCRDPGHMVA